MARLKSLGSGTLLAIGNVYAALSTFVVLSIVFNSVDLKTFGAISLLLTSVAICQIIFNTQSWQGLLNSPEPARPGLLRRCLAIDATAASVGAGLLALTYTLYPRALSQSTAAPSGLVWITINVALIPPGALIAVIRQEGRFAQQAFIDISAATLKIGMALCLTRGATSLMTVAMTLVLPELLRWCGYLALSASRLVQKDSDAPSKANQYPPPSPSHKLRAIYGFSIWGMLTEIIHLPTAHVDKILVSALLGLESLAIWDILKRCATTVVQATTVVNQMLFPHFVRIRSQSTVTTLTQSCLRQCLALSCLLLLLYGSATLTMPVWFPLAFHVDSAIWPLEHLQRVFGLLALVMTIVLGATPIHPLFLSLRHSSQSFRISLVGSILFFALSALLLPWWGLFGTSLAIFGSDLFIIVSKARMLYLLAAESRAVRA